MAAEPSTITATASLGTVVLRSVLAVTNAITATASVGAPTLVSVVHPYPILSWARLDPILVSGYDMAAATTVVVFNANTLAATEYSIAALDVVSHDGELYFVTADGLVKLAAGAAGVAGSITTGDLELASPGSVSLNLARLGLTADGELHLTATAHQDGGERSVRYLIPTRDGSNDRDRNVKLGNGVLGNAWSFTIAPPTGEACNWGLSSWKIEPGQFKLRRR